MEPVETKFFPDAVSITARKAFFTDMKTAEMCESKESSRHS